MRHIGRHSFLASLLLLLSAQLAGQDAYRIQILTEENTPLQFSQNGEAKGFAVDIVQAILEQTSLNGRIEIMPWARAYKMAQEQPNILLFSVRRTPEREHKFNWASQVFKHGFMPDYELLRMQSNMVLICHSDSDIKLNSIEQAQLFVIAAQRGDWLTEYLIDALHWPVDKMFLTRDFDDTIKMLAANRVDLAMMISQDYENIMKLRGFDISQFRQCLQIPKPIAHLYYSFSLGTDDHIVETFRSSIEDMFIKGHYQKLYEKWYPDRQATP